MSSPAPATVSARNVFRRFRRNRQGSAAVEFALVAPLFFGMLFAILETAIARSFWAAALWAVMLGCYSACSIAAALLIADRDVAPVLPVVFATYHLSYGLGFLCGLLYWKSRSTDAVAPAAVFTEISR